MRALPYARKLMAKRHAGERPWLVVVTLGEGEDAALKKALASLQGAHRIWVPDDYYVPGADLAWAIGLDVLVVPLCDTARLTQFLGMLWSARPSTLWQLDAGNTVTRLYPFRRCREGRDLMPHHPRRAPLARSLRDVVVRSRELALLAADEPLFDSPDFDAARPAVAA